MKKIINVWLLTTFLTVFYSCSQNNQHGRNFIIPVDFSSSRDSTIVDWYKQIIAFTILEKAGPQDRFTVLPIDHSSELWGQEIFRVDFGVFEFGNEYAGLQKNEVERANLKDSVQSAIRRFTKEFDLVRKQRVAYSEGTDILGALKLCQKYLSSDHENIIVLLSDMRQYTPNGTANLEGSGVKASVIEENLARAEGITLHNSTVVVLTGPQLDVPIGKFNLVRHFWEEYFKKCNAKLFDYSSGAVTKLEELTTTKAK